MKAFRMEAPSVAAVADIPKTPPEYRRVERSPPESSPRSWCNSSRNN